MKIFFLIIAIIIFGISGFNVISTLVEHHDFTAYDKGFMAGNLILLSISSLAVFIIQKNKAK